MDDRMDATSGKRIVELLRKAARGGYEGSKNKVMDDLAQLIGCDGGMHFHTIGKLADMVEEALQREHESAYDAGYDDGFASADDWCAHHEDAMAEHGWVRLPKDADGEVWHIGDVTENGEVVSAMRLDSHGWIFLCRNDIDPSIHRHYHAPTVEDTLHELIGKALMLSEIDGENELVAEYAKRLTLRGDGE